MTVRSLTIPIHSGSEPSIDEVDNAIDNAVEAIGSDEDYFFIDDMTEPCAQSPGGQCEYTVADNFERCRHCGRKSEP